MTENTILLRGQEVVGSLLASPDTFDGFNDLLSLFFRGLPIAILGELLRHPADRVVRGCLFISEELDVRAVPVLGEIVRHVRHPNAEVRVAAYEAIASVCAGEEKAFVHVVCGMRDSDLRCRKVVLLNMMRVPVITLRAALEAMSEASADEELQEGLQLLVGEAGQNPATVAALLVEQVPLARKFGLVAAGRVAETHYYLLEQAAHSSDTDLQTIASTHMQFLAILHRHGRTWHP